MDDDYFHRNESGRLETNITQLQGLLAKTIIINGKTSEPGGVFAAGYAWRLCRALVRRGEQREKKADKLADYDMAQKDCEKSVALNADDADAHFWYGISMGRWGEAKGILKAMFLIKPIRKEMAETLRLDPHQGGAHRVLGEMLWQIPGFAGGDKKQALAEYETAVKMSPDHSTNYQVLAEAYLHFDRKNDAIRTLKAVAQIKNPADSSDYPGDLADSKKLLEKLNAK